MNKKYIIHQFFYRASNPTAGDKKFGRVLMLCAVLFMIAGFGRLISIENPSGSTAFDWLIYASLTAILLVNIIAILWRIRDIMKQMDRANEGK